MAVSYGTLSTDAGTSSSSSLTKPAGLADDDVLVLAVNIEDTTPGIVWPSGFTQRANVTDSVHGLAVATKYVSDASSEPANYTVTFGNQYYTTILGPVSGLDTSDHFDVIGTNSGNSTSIGCPSITTADDNYEVLCIYCNFYWDAQTHPGSTTRWGSVDTTAVFGTEGIEMTYFTQATAGATGVKTATLSTARNWIGFQMAVIPLADGIMVLRRRISEG